MVFYINLSPHRRAFWLKAHNGADDGFMETFYNSPKKVVVVTRPKREREGDTAELLI